MRISLSILVVLFLAPVVQAQFGTLTAGGAAQEVPKSQKQRWKVGVEVLAKSGPCAGIYATAAIPSDWPEQTVKIVERNVSSTVRSLRFRKSKDGVEQMLVEIPRLPAGQKAMALLIFEIEKKSVAAPEKPETLVLPKKLPRNLLKTLGASPFIETRTGPIRTKSKELIAGHEKPWDRAKAIYDFVRDNIRFQEGKLKGATATLRDGFGQKEDLSNLFIALCRAARIPARTVWVAQHSYAEFYLEDAEGKGHWFPCELAGQRHFGAMPDFRPILQRGDNFKVPEKKKPQRFVAEFLKGKTGRGLGRPSVKFVRELLPAQ